jgi:hypothetical protein
MQRPPRAATPPARPARRGSPAGVPLSQAERGLDLPCRRGEGRAIRGAWEGRLQGERCKRNFKRSEG